MGHRLRRNPGKKLITFFFRFNSIGAIINTFVKYALLEWGALPMSG